MIAKPELIKQRAALTKQIEALTKQIEALKAKNAELTIENQSKGNELRQIREGFKATQATMENATLEPQPLEMRDQDTVHRALAILGAVSSILHRSDDDEPDQANASLALLSIIADELERLV